MAKKALQLASVASMIDQFNIPNIKILQSLGYSVDVVADFTNPGTITAERCENLKKRLADMNVHVFDIPIPRSLNPAAISSAYKQVKKLLEKENYNLLHCHSPIGGVIARQAAKGLRKNGLKVIYTAHGFHFYDGAPLKNWIIFYPIEKYYSKYTDVLITINKEDYKRATEHFHAGKTVYIPGVGVDTEKFKPRENGRDKIRKELGLDEGRILLLSVGELNENKNHSSVIKALAGVENITYAIVGKGEKKGQLEHLAIENNIDLRLPGFRTDVADFYDAADIYILPSIREGLNVSLMEAMASGLQCLCGSIRGNVDLVDEGKGGFLFRPIEVDEIRTALERSVKMTTADRQEQGRYNLEKIRSFDLQTVENLSSEIYGGGYKHLVEILKRQEKRAEIGIPVDAKLLISVGELSVRKNHKVVVEALQSLPDDYWYVIIGKGQLKERLKAMDNTGRLKLLGFRTDIVELLHSADLFVFPSLQEGLPVALIEALSSGVPCVASNIRGNNDLMDAGLVDNMNSMDWKKAILIGGSRADMNPFSRQVVEERMVEMYQ